jgi:RsiW-degrading membrane proteinase PrsW (M82 family)
MIIWVLEKYSPDILMAHIWVFYIFFLMMTPGIYLLAVWGADQKGGSSVWIILGSEILKMILSLSLCALAIFRFHPEPRVFGFNFFILYILFSTFEIYCLLHNLRRQKKAEKTLKDAC